MSDMQQPFPRPDFSVDFVCRYESEIDRAVVLYAMGHYIEAVIGTRDILFVKVPMEAVNKTFALNPMYPGDEIEFRIDHRRNNVIQNEELSGDELPPIWSVLTSPNGVNIITTIEPCKFIVARDSFDAFKELMSHVEIAPKEYNYAALNSVHWNETTRILRRDIEFFVKGKKLFDDRGLPYNRSYLLHGPPGNGKTTTIRAIAKFLNAKPKTFDFSASRNTPDGDFLSWVLGESERIARNEDHDEDDAPHRQKQRSDDESKTPIRLLILEDIDRLFPKDEPKQTAVSLQAVLQALDGAIERRNTVIIATANHPKSLDQQVLARPGRFDKQVFYEQPTLELAHEFLKRLFEGESDVSDEVLLRACNELKGHSYAFHKELFASAASYAIEDSRTTLEDADVEKGLSDLVTHIDGVLLKSERVTLGIQ